MKHLMLKLLLVSVCVCQTAFAQLEKELVTYSRLLSTLQSAEAISWVCREVVSESEKSHANYVYPHPT